MKTTTRAVTFSLDREISNKLARISRNLGITQSALISELLANPINQLDAHFEKTPAQNPVLQRGKHKAREKLDEIEISLMQRGFDFTD